MARTQRRIPPPPPSRPLAGSPPTPVKLPGWSAILDTITAEELDNDVGEVILLPPEYEERSEVEPEAYWRNQHDASRCWTTTFIYQHIQSHPRLARFIRPDEWTGLPVLAKPDGLPLETFIKSHKTSMYDESSSSDSAPTNVRIQDEYKPLIYQWALQLANALAHIHSYGKAETPSIWIAFGDIDISKCWLTTGLNIQLVGFLNAACQTPGESTHFGTRTNGSAFHPLEGKRGEDDSPTEQTDVSMWGCLVYELMTGAWPDNRVPDPEVVTTGQWPRLEVEYLGEIIGNCWTGEIADAASLMDKLRSTISGLGWQVIEDVLVGFDAEALFAQSGTGRTIPFNCQAIPPQDYFPQAKESLTDSGLVEDAWRTAELYAIKCSEAQAATSPFLSTPFVARDMLEILKHLPDEKLNYVGTLYGTFLGEVFASMFPEHVGRFVLDAVVNPTDWRAGTRDTFLQDTDIVYEEFYSECAVRPDNCALTSLVPGPADSAAIRNIVESSFSQLLAVDQLVYRIIKNVFRQALYAPSTWPSIASTLTSLIAPPNATSPGLNTTSPNITSPPPPYNQGVDAFWGISCLDTPWRLSGPSDLIPIADRQQPLSYFANVFADATIWRCAAWSIEPAEYYAGPFEAHTATPILFVGGKRDPITPLSAAFNASRGFPGSRVLTNDGYGHSFFNDPSQCTFNAVRAYLVDGTLPEERKVCVADKKPFDSAFGTAW